MREADVIRMGISIVFFFVCFSFLVLGWGQGLGLVTEERGVCTVVKGVEEGRGW